MSAADTQVTERHVQERHVEERRPRRVAHDRHWKGQGVSLTLSGLFVFGACPGVVEVSARYLLNVCGAYPGISGAYVGPVQSAVGISHSAEVSQMMSCC